MKPHLQSLILANHVYQDKISNNFVIAGTFNTLQFRQGPPNGTVPVDNQATEPQQKSITELRAAGSPWLYFSLTDIVGEVACSIRYVFLKDNQVLFSTSFKIRSLDRLATCECRLELPELPIIQVGQYALEFLAQDEMIGSLRIMAVPDPASGGEPKT